ncbi:MAG: ribulose-phosphate 3-epimerase [Oscillospiraceae bacterium]|jgi:D-allulose-6-phosphate 3-epimerase|nr:ribulose-phosphate 3-epimerase [Oscillospiraceae bacterium]
MDQTEQAGRGARDGQAQSARVRCEWAAPSLMCMDFLRIKEQLEVVARRATFGHVDVMDGHFAPNLTLSPDMVRVFRRVTDMPLDAHLMTTDPSRWIEPFAQAGASIITLHAETIWNNAFRLFDKIEALGCQPGLALCPATTIGSVEHLLERARLLTIMSVDIGYAGSPFIPEMLTKIEEARDFRERKGLRYVIQVDGGCGAKTFKPLKAAGANLFVLGTSLFRRGEAERDLDVAFDAVVEEFHERR